MEANKTIKVSEKAQQSLKIFAAKNQYSMSVIASDAILQYIKAENAKNSKFSFRPTPKNK
jgi:predicted transcriptional regulator